MKAKQWVERFQTVTAEQMGDEFQSFIAEATQIAHDRGNTPNAIEGAVREQRQKWNAILAIYPALSGFSFDQLMSIHAPTLIVGVQQYEKATKKSPSQQPHRQPKKNNKPRSEPQPKKSAKAWGRTIVA